jgi:hypothetical protein
MAKLINKTSSKPLKIAGHVVERISVGKHTLGQIVINNDVTVVFRIKEGGGGPGSGKCLACKISNIVQCANLVCPDIKANDPNASCADAIRECTELACRNSCKSAFGGGDILILA